MFYQILSILCFDADFLSVLGSGCVSNSPYSYFDHAVLPGKKDV